MSSERVRATYRHGHLREALVAEGVELARDGGPDAVTLREVTRRAGVAANAAYRHFEDRDALLSAVSVAALGIVATEMDDEIERATRVSRVDDRARAEEELDAVGRAYVRFALRQPGLFRAAFTVHRDLHRSFDGEPGAGRAIGPLGRLTAALDHCAAAGVIPTERRAGAEVAAWSAVHGLACLLLDGPLRDLGEPQRAALTEQVLRMVRDGLRAAPGGALSR
ncbi:TetR/AcrR family transcriptional regulator [Amnibacterium sp.]|uniref:TetR/AcrR family transcriptional regulator n=1 Tax=Amnibacterium sp. TaxID=1872496 RepID=UPI002627619F|nr:TetR/AcrR family transcriptional regulator [Amnibacterium sp.]